MARGDAGEVAEAARGEREQLVRVLAAVELVHQRIREEVRQVAHRREHLVMLLRRHLAGTRAATRPGLVHFLHRLRRVFLQRRDDHPSPAEQLRVGRTCAALLRARDRMRRHELADLLLQNLARRGDHVALGAAGIGDDGARLEGAGDRAEDLRELADRGRHQDKIGVFHRTRGIAR